jgi:DNA polymerase III alpha subunit
MAVIGNAAMDGRTVLEWDKDDIDALGLLSCLRRGFDLLRRRHRLDLDLVGVPRDCAETYSMLRRADSRGVFQVESRAQMNMLPRLRPEKFYDLVIQVAIIRPGPIQGDMVHPYIRRRCGLEQPVYPSPSLPAEPAGQAAAMDYAALGLTLGQHPLALLLLQLVALGCQDTRQLEQRKAGSKVLLAGLVLMRQRPGTAKGVVFVTLEDEWGTANLVVWAEIGARDRAALLGARLMLVEGSIQRETEHAEIPITHVIGRRLIDRTDLLHSLRQEDALTAWVDALLGRADAVRRPDPGSARGRTKVPTSRDFH